MWSGNEYRALRQFVDIIQTDTEKMFSTGGKGLFLAFVQSASFFAISNSFSSKTTEPIKAKFLMETSWFGRTKAFLNACDHVTKMSLYACSRNLDPYSKFLPAHMKKLAQKRCIVIRQLRRAM